MATEAASPPPPTSPSPPSNQIPVTVRPMRPPETQTPLPAARQTPPYLLHQFATLTPQQMAAMSGNFWQVPMVPVAGITPGMVTDMSSAGAAARMRFPGVPVQFVAIQGQAHGGFFPNMGVPAGVPDMARAAHGGQIAFMSPQGPPGIHFYAERPVLDLQNQQQMQQQDVSAAIAAAAASVAAGSPGRHVMGRPGPGKSKLHGHAKDASQADSNAGDAPIYPEALADHHEVVGDKEKFLDTLSKFHEAIGSQLLIPKIGGNDFDVHRLYCEVTAHGGFEQVIREKKWKDIAAAFDLPSTITSPSYFLRKHYLNLLHHYEQVYYFGYQGEFVPPPAFLPTPMPSLHPNNSIIGHPVAEDGEPVKKKRRKKFEHHQLQGVDPASSIGNIVTGAIEGKFEHGYFVTVVVGSEKLRGVLYNVPSGNQSEQFAALPELMNNIGLPLSSPELDVGLRRKRRRPNDLRKKDPTAPRAYRTGYNFFFADQRRRLKGCKPKDKDVGRIIGDRWNAMTEDERLPYMLRGQEDKERYNREMSAYEERSKMHVMNDADVNTMAVGFSDLRDDLGHEGEEEEEEPEYGHEQDDGTEEPDYHVSLGAEVDMSQQQYIHTDTFTHYESTEQMGYEDEHGEYAAEQDGDYDDAEQQDGDYIPQQNDAYIPEQTNYAEDHGNYEQAHEYEQGAYG